MKGVNSSDIGRSSIEVETLETMLDFVEIHHRIWLRLGRICWDLEEIRPDLDEILPDLNEFSVDLEEICPDLD